MRKIVFLIFPLFLYLLGGCAPSEPKSWDNIRAKAACATRIKSLLNDPDSYEFESATITETSGKYNEYGKAYIIYKAKNISGEYTSKGAECERYIQNGSAFIKSRLLEK
tara:strand:+ start:149 stop:475 length:327 start_codon:yes stop_codon:yes gene_type:complete